jgi:hypothetical protein
LQAITQQPNEYKQLLNSNDKSIDHFKNQITSNETMNFDNLEDAFLRSPDLCLLDQTCNNNNNNNNLPISDMTTKNNNNNSIS